MSLTVVEQIFFLEELLHALHMYSPSPLMACVLLLVAVLYACPCTAGERQSTIDWKGIVDNAYIGEKVWKPAVMPTRTAVLGGLCPHGYFGDQSRLRSMALKIEDKQEFNIAILGGSVPKVGNYTYPSVLQDFLSPYIPFKVNVFVFAIRGSPSASQVNRFPELRQNIKGANIDLVIMDIAANDVPTHSWIQREHRDISQRNIKAEGREEMELLLNHLVDNNTAILYFETPTKTQRQKPYVLTPADMSLGEKGGYKYNDLADLRYMTCASQDVASHLHWVPLISLHIPIISYFDIGCALEGIPVSRIWGGNIHPADHVHRLAGTALGLGVLELIHIVTDTTGSARQCPAATPELVRDWDQYVQTVPVVEKMARACSYQRMSFLSSDTSFVPAWHGSAWAYYEDVKGKLGWISNHKYPSSKNSSDTDWDIHFNLNLTAGAHYHIRLSLLVSYAAEMGGLRCCLDCDRFVPEFSCNTLIRDRLSVTQEFLFSKPTNAHNTSNSAPFLSDMSAFGDHILKCRADKKKKVKIVGIVGC